MAYHLTIQQFSKAKHIPSRRDLKKFILATLQSRSLSAKITLRITNKKESAQLNEAYRHKTGPTNVLSFDYSIEPTVGDIVLCAPLINQQALAQGKIIKAHWAHLIVHGCLHLLGYDHIKKRDAKIMEALEINILHHLGFENPYA